LKGYGLWITGLRADQSDNRSHMNFFEWDNRFKIVKVNPLLHWTFKQVMDFIHSNFVPYNLLHDKGFVSIGCAPCTRAIQEGEDFARALVVGEVEERMRVTPILNLLFYHFIIYHFFIESMNR